MKDYIDLNTWISTVAHPQDTSCRTADFHRCATEKHAIAQRFCPQRIAEIGVRLGYSAHAFMAGAANDAGFFGFDIVGGLHGGTKIAGFEWVEGILRRDFPQAVIKTVKMNTQDVAALPVDGIDFFHIDGDHSFPGALHDMMLAWPTIRPGGVMLVDDYDFVREVRRAVDRFACDYVAQIANTEYVKTFRGDIIITKK
jgi:hypothetical protein